MTDFTEFLDNLLRNPLHKTKISIKGRTKQVKAMAKLVSMNYPNEPYLKIIFIDGSFLLIQPKEKEIYYAPSLLGKAPGIANEDIGKKKVLTFNDKKYRLENKDDYQFCLQLYIGSPLDIEGECRFSDYFPETGPKEYLSLGWLVRTGERADINCQIIDLADLDMVLSNKSLQTKNLKKSVQNQF